MTPDPVLWQDHAAGAQGCIASSIAGERRRDEEMTNTDALVIIGIAMLVVTFATLMLKIIEMARSK